MLRHALKAIQRTSSASFPKLFSTAPVACGKLDGRVAIVTAGTCGIGFAMSKRLAEDGAHVVVSSRQRENVDKAAKELQDRGLKASGFMCHVGNPEERQEMLKDTEAKFGGIDILIQNAGVNPYLGPILDTPPTVVDKVCDLHIKSNMMIVQEVVPYMKKRKHKNPAILLTSSVSGHRADVFSTAYAISKSAIYTIVHAYMPSLTPLNIRINCLNLGPFDTDFFASAKSYKDNDAVFMQHISMRRYAKTDEVAGITSLLCSDEGSFITGETFAITGGLYTRH